jgi:hypothetical protein
MQRFSVSARWVATAIFIPILIAIVSGVAVEFIKQQPRETANVVLKFLLDLTEQPWLRFTAFALGGFVAGLWLDWLLRKLDDTRADERKALGIEMLLLARQLADIRYPMHEARPRIRSRFATATKLGLWVPDDRVFQLHPPYAYQEVSNYLRQVGRMLKDGNFREARQDAKKSKAAFDKAYALHGLPPK